MKLIFSVTLFELFRLTSVEIMETSHENGE